MDHRTKKDQIIYLMERCLAQIETAQERQELDAYLDALEPDQDIDDIVLQAFAMEKECIDMSQQKQTQILEAIRNIGSPYIAPHRFLQHWIKWASVAALVILTLTPFVIGTKNHNMENVVRALSAKDTTHVADTYMEPILHAQKDRATLTMADGAVLSLDELAVGQKIIKDGFSLVKLEEGKLLFDFKTNNGSNPSIGQMQNILTTPKGNIYRIVLADGTRVQLNGSSRLTFPSAFGEKQRKVFLEGEAYFEVAKELERQFIVSSGRGYKRQEVIVYGTAFNVSAFPNDGAFLTTLAEGSVKIRNAQNGQEIFIKPLEQAEFRDGAITVAPAKMNVNLAWLNNLFYFEDSDITTVMKQIGRWYGVDIVFIGDKPTAKLWGQISRTKELPDVLDILKQTNGIKFEIKGKEVSVMTK